ncbi:hypothetical protein E2C01_087486 [Portunus trituberculatus]|uniref:Uncharacterized protein n=1 Tax=Portunus trituberculatus TaxID=210409 RepID=A0A5B7JHE4_PORTR|nr:hypothetical protein [Portunus trituberculatus]
MEVMADFVILTDGRTDGQREGGAHTWWSRLSWLSERESCEGERRPADICGGSGGVGVVRGVGSSRSSGGERAWGGGGGAWSRESWEGERRATTSPKLSRRRWAREMVRVASLSSARAASSPSQRSSRCGGSGASQHEHARSSQDLLR